jgi:hypothetical protein
MSFPPSSGGCDERSLAFGERSVALRRAALLDKTEFNFIVCHKTNEVN